MPIGYKYRIKNIAGYHNHSRYIRVLNSYQATFLRIRFILSFPLAKKEEKSIKKNLSFISNFMLCPLSYSRFEF